MSTLRASVVVPTRNRHALLADSLESLLKQDVPRDDYEIIVVDDGSEPPVVTPDGVSLVRHDRPRGPSAARNTGAKAASSELVVYVDDDIDAPEDWLQAVLEGTDRFPDDLCFTGKVILRLEGEGPRFCDQFSLVAQGESALDFGPEDMAIEWGTCAANMAIRRAAFDLIGEFREDHPIYFEETEWSERLRHQGCNVIYLANAALWHRRTADDLRLTRRVRRSFKHGYGEAFKRYVSNDPFTWRVLAWKIKGIPGLLLHSARHRCTFGVCMAANECGKLWWRIAGQRPTEPVT